MNIHEIQDEISSLFSKYKIPVITKKMPIENLHRWASEVAAHFSLDEDEFSKTMTELFWSTAHIQLSLGYALIARQDCIFPKGKKGRAFRTEDIPNAISIPEIHFWYHIYNSYECIYRCWERITSVIKSVCYPEDNQKMYFDQIVNKLDDDAKYNKNPHLQSLKKRIKHWNKAAGARNEISHGNSSPFRNMSIEGKASDVLGLDGIPLIYLNYSVNSPKERIDEIVDKYKKVFPAMEVMVAFIDNIDR
mgnify:FL=1